MPRTDFVATVRRKVLLIAALAALFPRAVFAQAPSQIADEQQLLWQRFEAQQAEINALRLQLETHAPPANAGVANASFEAMSLESKTAETANAEAKPNPGYEIGSDLKMSARWDTNTGIVFETPNKDFVSHIGVRTEMDVVGFGETPGLAKSANFGTLEDGAFFRRIRPSWDGTAYDLMEWQVQLALEQINNNVPNWNELWVGLKDLPYVGTFRIGHIRVAQGFESGQYSSDKVGTAMETSTAADAFMQITGTGFWLTDSILDQHMTWTAQAYKQDGLNNYTGADFDSGKWGYTGRVTALPFYQDDGRHMLHLGLSGTWRDAQSTAVGTAPVTVFQARPELRDQIGSTPLGNSSRLVSTGNIVSDANSVVGTELFYVLGPASLQAEYNWAFIDDAIVKNVKHDSLPFDGGYIQMTYCLTGENRLYDRRLARLGSIYNNGPYTPFWLVRDENGDCCWGCGSWELFSRFSHLDLDDAYVTGGKTDAFCAGVNWYLNPNLNVRLEYLHQTVYGGGPNPDGIIDGFGMRTQFFF